MLLALPPQSGDEKVSDEGSYTTATDSLHAYTLIHHHQPALDDAICVCIDEPQAPSTAENLYRLQAKNILHSTARAAEHNIVE